MSLPYQSRPSPLIPRTHPHHPKHIKLPHVSSISRTSHVTLVNVCKSVVPPLIRGPFLLPYLMYSPPPPLTSHSKLPHLTRPSLPHGLVSSRPSPPRKIWKLTHFKCGPPSFPSYDISHTPIACS
jgi:hypothetical protein